MITQISLKALFLKFKILKKISAGSYKFPAPFAVLGENLIYVDVFGGRNILKFNFETKFNILKLIILIGS
jgi:hypothetical protein